jgi:hypothetical protein
MASDLREQRQATRDLIDNWPVEVTFLRENDVEVYGGTRPGTPSAQVPRQRYLTVLNKADTIPDNARYSELGAGWMISHVLIGEHDDDMVQDDEFECDDVLYRIVDVERRGGYETRGLCATKQITHN